MGAEPGSGGYVKGRRRERQDDDSAGLDSYLRFKVPADGEYYLSVRDQLGRGGPAFTYRVEVTPVHPDLALAIPEIVKYSQERQTIVVPKGNRFATMLRAQRADFDGPFTLDALESDFQRIVTGRA